MLKRWVSDYVVTEHRDLQANTMALDTTGSYVLLAGRRFLAIKKLDDSDELDSLKKYPRQSKYEVGSAEWNPTISNYHFCAISSNTRIEILSVAGNNNQDLPIIHTLKGHNRVVSDLNWHPKEPDIIASCSIDTFIHVWDLRDSRKPSLSLSAVAGSSQVKWSPLLSYTLATAHDGDIKIWDQRKSNSPVQYIAAHLTKIHGLDWCPFQQNQIATSSQDCTVKVFDICNPRKVDSILSTNYPVWRARYTPFGESLVTIVVPPLRRGENSLLLWNIANLNTPIHTFVGHTDVVLEFQWRHPKVNSNDYELITWSKDQCLRIFKIDGFLKKLCGHDMDDATSLYTQYSEDTNLRALQSVQDLQLNDSQNDNELSYSSSQVDMQMIPNEASTNLDHDKELPSPTQPKTLQQEFSLINMNIPNIELNSMDVIERSCTVTARNKNYHVILKVNFPGNYPYSAQPTFQFCSGTTVDNTTMAKLLRVLKQTSQQRVKKNRTCLEPCLRQLIITLEQTCVPSESESNLLDYHIQSNADFLNSTTICTNYQDNYIPFPRTSGAKFCSLGILVCFGRSTFTRRSFAIKPDGSTPRSLSALGNSGNNGSYMNLYSNSYGQSGDTMSISSFYFPERQQRSSRKNVYNSSVTQNQNCYNKNYYSLVTVYDTSLLFFVNKELAEKYILNLSEIPSMCQHNANVASLLNRPDLIQAWCLSALVISPLSNPLQNLCQIQDIVLPWPLHPFGQKLVHSLIQHYVNQSDIQMAGMLSCVFSDRSESHGNSLGYLTSKSVNVSPGSSPYHTIHHADTSSEGWSVQNLKYNRSSSWSESLDDSKTFPDSLNDTGRSIRLLDENNTLLYDRYKKVYAEVLHRWRLLDGRAQILKHVSASHLDSQKDVKLQSECHLCKQTNREPQCTSCKRLTFQCIICHISVKGHSTFCLICGHGGHTQHLAAWFTNERVCPTGCGCACLQENASYQY
ncbi:Similar to WDR59: GATOR complex protein WDR59 (Homo sapiens) [Cotesia congregata]|uniref:Similar to WDR59: GATOR complex protein WDR59 (Homo sapiens) n=1 Tax=Cotesia congregata TaxID=51543 RepID=A0A8J2MMQ8_COTCN|nr:Similar to WDR59: GATOR complex protein WDR59 (Homo sapiens) [Cotesia congregata]